MGISGWERYLPIGFVLQLLHFLPPNSQSQELPLSPGAFFLEFMEVWRELSPKQSGRAAEQRSQEAANAKKQERSSQKEQGTAAAARNSGWEQAGTMRKGSETGGIIPKILKCRLGWSREWQGEAQKQKKSSEKSRDSIWDGAGSAGAAGKDPEIEKIIPKIPNGSRQGGQKRGKTGRGSKPGGIIPKFQLGVSRQCRSSRERLKNRRKHPRIPAGKQQGMQEKGKAGRNHPKNPGILAGMQQGVQEKGKAGRAPKAGGIIPKLQERAAASQNSGWDGARSAAGAGKGRERLQQEENEKGRRKPERKFQEKRSSGASMQENRGKSQG